MEEELLVYAILFYEEIFVTQDIYQKRLDELFLENSDNDMLLYLEWEADINRAMIYIRTQVDYQNLNQEKFGAILMDILKDYYAQCADVRIFADRMYSLWESLPGTIHEMDPFWMLSYADDPLSWKDEEQTKAIYEKMLNYYHKE